ncbi:unnamed protein product, partial [Hapterophycus canaliculatus]
MAHETCRTAPLKRHGWKIGTVTLRVWKVAAGKHPRLSVNSDLVSGGVPSEHADGSNPAALDPDAATTNVGENNGDDKLFFELSNSSGLSSSTSAPLTIPGSSQSSGEMSMVFGTLASGTGAEAVEDEGPFKVPVQQLSWSHQLEVVNDHERPEASGGILEVVNAQAGYNLGVEAQTIYKVSAESEVGLVPTSTSSFDSASDLPGDKQPKERESLPLDIEATMLPLIPCYPSGSARIQVRVRSIILPICVPPANPPYVRVSLHPGAHIIVRTGLASAVASLRTTRTVPSRDKKNVFVLLAKAFQAGSVAHHRFAVWAGGVGANNQVLMLPLGPDVVRIASAANGGPSSPTIRLEIVSGRSLGYCELALPEVLRRPGKYFPRLQVPIWKKKSSKQRGQRSSVEKQTTDANAKDEDVVRREGDYVQDHELAGQVEFDLGVVLTGQSEDSQSGIKASAVQLSSGVVTVEASAYRVRDAKGRRVKFEILQQTTGRVVGISARLSLGGETRLAALDRGSYDRKEVEQYEPAPPRAIESRTIGKCLLRSICTQLDVLTLRLAYRRPIENSNDPGLEVEGNPEDQPRERDALAIAVSDINDVFDGNWQWVPIHSFPPGRGADDSRGGRLGKKARAVGCENDFTDVSVGERLEVKLRVCLVDEAPIFDQEDCGPNGPEKGVDTEYAQSVAKCSAESRSGNESLSTLQAWVESPSNGCSQACVMVPCLENRGGLLPHDGKIGGDQPVKALGPGVFELEVLAIYGRRREGWPARVVDGECDNQGDRQASMVHFPRPWWVRIAFADKAGEENNSFVVDSSSGVLSSFEEGDDWKPAEKACATPPVRQKQGERCRCGVGWVVSWPHGGRALARRPVHWTPSQSVLPVIYLEVFRGQTLAARSVLELPPLVAREGPLAFAYPCSRVGKGGTKVPAIVTSDSDSDDGIVLDVRCSFNCSS